MVKPLIDGAMARIMAAARRIRLNRDRITPSDVDAVCEALRSGVTSLVSHTLSLLAHIGQVKLPG
jgi:hypothetical protein